MVRIFALLLLIGVAMSQALPIKFDLTQIINTVIKVFSLLNAISKLKLIYFSMPNQSYHAHHRSVVFH